MSRKGPLNKYIIIIIILSSSSSSSTGIYVYGIYVRYSNYIVVYSRE